MVLVHEPVRFYMCDVLCALGRNCGLILPADVWEVCVSLSVLLYLLIQAIEKSTGCPPELSNNNKLRASYALLRHECFIVLTNIDLVGFIPIRVTLVCRTLALV